MSRSGYSHRARRMTGVCALIVALLMLVWQAAALAGPGTGSTGQQTDPGTAQEAPPPAEDTEASAPTTEDKETTVLKGDKTTAAQEEAPEEEVTGGASATSSVVDLEIAGEDILVVSESQTEASDDGCSARATPLFLIALTAGENTAECQAGQDTVSQGGIIPLEQSCEMSSGAICLALLWGYAQATDTEESTESNSQSEGVSACLGGEQLSPRDNCDGPIGARVAHSESRSTRNKETGEASAQQENSLVEVCLGGTDPETGVCSGLGIILLHSEGSAIARPGQTAEIEGGASTVIVEATGEEQGSFSENIAIPPGCDDIPDEERPGALCVALNDSDVNAEAGKGTAHQEAISLDAITVIGGSIDQGDLSADSTKVKERIPPTKPPKKEPKPKKKKPTLAGPAGPALANTGASVLPTIFFALALMILGLRLVRTPVPARR